MQASFRIFLLLLSILFNSCSSSTVNNVDSHKLDAKEIYKRTVNNTVTVVTESGLGSGFFVDTNKIITNYHVIENIDKANIILNNSDKKYTVLGYLAVDKANDLVLLQIDFNNVNFIKLESKMPQPGEKVYAIGSPIGLAKTISEGIVSGIRDFEHKKLLQITAPISQGSSGCPILNEEGNVVGVAVAGIDNASNVGFCIPSNFVNTLLDFKSEYYKELSTLFVNKKIEKKETAKNNNPENENKKPPLTPIQKRYLGKHLLTVYFLMDGDKSYGSVNIKLENGKYILNGSQENKESNCWFKINGYIDIIDIDNFIFHGTIKVYNPGDFEQDKKFNFNKMESAYCEWTGSEKFYLFSKDRSYWRMKGGCFSHTGDIDIFFKR